MDRRVEPISRSNAAARWAAVDAGRGAAERVAVVGGATVFGAVGCAFDSPAEDRVDVGVLGLAVTVTVDVTGADATGDDATGDAAADDAVRAEEPLHAVSPARIARAATAVTK